MNEMEVRDGNRTHGEVADEFSILLRQMLHGPDAGGLSYGIEPLEIFKAHAGAIVIASDRGFDIFPHPIDYWIGVGAIADQIATTENMVVLSVSVCQDRLESLPVTMKIADDKVSHERLGRRSLHQTDQRNFRSRADARRDPDGADAARDVAG
jgi:hypothetical protein